VHFRTLLLRQRRVERSSGSIIEKDSQSLHLQWPSFIHAFACASKLYKVHMAAKAMRERERERERDAFRFDEVMRAYVEGALHQNAFVYHSIITAPADRLCREIHQSSGLCCLCCLCHVTATGIFERTDMQCSHESKSPSTGCQVRGVRGEEGQ
jgi:hypothetical protein